MPNSTTRPQDEPLSEPAQSPTDKAAADQIAARLTAALDKHQMTRHPFGGLRVFVSAPQSSEPHLSFSGSINVAAAELLASVLELRPPG